MNALKGIDISKHNSGLNFKKLKSAGVDFVMIRAGYGGIVDPKLEAHTSGAKAAGMMVGFYWFCYALDVAGARREAELCCRTIAKYKPELPIFHDFEYDTERYAGTKGVKYTPKLRTDIITAFCERVKDHGFETGVYTNPDYWLYRLETDRLKEYNLWIAAYKRKDCKATFDSVPPSDLPPAYRNAMIWQPGKCRLPGGGIGDIDIDYGYGMKKQETKTYKVGDTYTVKEDDIYTNGKPVPKRVVGRTYTIWQVKPDAILLKEIVSWVKTKKG